MPPVIKPLESRFDAFYYDGGTPVRHPVVLEFDRTAFRLIRDGVDSPEWAYEQTRIACDGAYDEPVRLERIGGKAGETLVVPNGSFMEALGQHAPPLARLNSPGLHLTGWPAVLLACIVIVCLASVLYFWGLRWLADTAARFTPLFVEERLGRSVVNVLTPEPSRCTLNPGAEASLKTIADRLAAAAPSHYQFRILYANQKVPNAFAAPGGYIVVFRGLLEQTETPEEFAGVLAHEMQHVLHKHSTRALARHISGRTLLSLMAMDSAGTPTAIEAGAALLNLSYQRSDEEEADSESARMLAAARIRPDGLVRFLRRMQGDPLIWEPSRYLSTHPALAERAARMQAETSKISAPYEPLMTTEEWAAAKRVCVVPAAH